MNTNNSNGNSSKSSTGRRGSNKGATARAGAEAATSQAHVETVAPPVNEIEIVVASTNENVEGNVNEMNATNVLSEETVSSASVIETSTNEGNVNAMETTTTTTTIETVTTNDNATIANAPENASNDESADIAASASSLVEPNDEPVLEVVELTSVDRVLIGVNLDNAVLKGLTASKESLLSKIELAKAQVAEYETALATTEEQIAAESKGGNLEGKAREAATQMLNFFGEEAVHVALIKQYGAIRGVPSAVAKHAESDGSGATTAAGTPRLRNPAQVTKKVTLSIGAREQKKILDKVAAMGDKGARMEDLVEELGIDQVQILGTLKNGIFDGKLRKDGASRGMRYFATKDAAPAPTAPSTAAE